jgi:hypothetical protein
VGRCAGAGGFQEFFCLCLFDAEVCLGDWVYKMRDGNGQIWAAYDAAGVVCLGGGEIESTDRCAMWHA